MKSVFTPPSVPGGDLSPFLVSEKQTLWDAMRAIADNAREVVFVHNDHKKVTGAVTDGDIRRGLLRGLPFEAPVVEVMSRNFHRAHPGEDRSSVLDLMRVRDIRHVPVLDAAGSLVGLHFLRDLIGAAERPNLGLIMAGGRGMRLRPLTESLPKPLTPVAGRPILERLVMHLVGNGVRRVAISVNYLGHMIEEYFGDGAHLGCSITYLREDRALGTGGALRLLPEQEEHPILVLNGDLVTQCDLGGLLDHHARASAGRGVRATMAVKAYQHVVPYGVAEVEDERLRRLVEKPRLEFLVNAGIYVIDPDLVELVDEGVDFPITRLFEKCLEQDIPAGIYSVSEEWRDVGTFEELMVARGLATANKED